MKHLILFIVLISQSLSLFGQYDIVYDSTFGSNGIAVIHPFSIDTKVGVLLQPDDKIVLLGERRISTDLIVFTVLRLNEDGTLDTTYNNIGFNDNPTMFDADYTHSDRVGLLLPNNDLVVGGTGPYLPQSNSKEVYLYKYLEDGTIDGQFGNAGAVHISKNSAFLQCSDLKRYNDTTMLVLVKGDNALYKIKINGSIDSSFATNGRLEIPANLLANVSQMAINFDGSIFILGTINSFSKIIKLNADLSFDTSFQHASDWFISNIDLDEDGKIIVQGGMPWAAYKHWRLMPDGTLDQSFNKTGVLHGNVNVTVGQFNQIIKQDDGKLLFGFSGGATAIRINPNGTLDYSFSLDGFADIIPVCGDFTGPCYAGSGMVLQTDGKMVFMTEDDSKFIKIIRVKTRP